MKTLVVADDQRALRRLVRITLENKDLRVLEARDGAEALETVRKTKPDMVLLDVAMPGLNGLEVCRALRADPSLAGVRVVMLTALGHESDREAGMAAGADAYLTKPFSPLELMRLVDELLGT